jgi:peptidoglycan/LPS O-acetylase OafA/YrhL
MQLKRLFERQISPGRTFIPEIDGFRFMAILSVVLFHLYGQTLRYYPARFPAILSIMLHNGDRGVRLFFVISGFILALPFARHHLCGSPAVSIQQYLGRRVTRLEPPYIASLLLQAVLIFLVLHEKLADVVVHLLASIGYCHNLVFAHPSTISGVTWSLEVEVQFYLLVPFLTAIFALRNPLWRRGILIASIVLMGFLQAIFPGPLRWQMTIGYFLEFFLAGFLLADLYLTAAPIKRSWGWDAVSVACWPLVFLISDFAVQWTLPALTVLLYWAGFQGRLVNAFFRNPAVVCIGGACYSIYLLHFPVIAQATRFAGHQHAWLMWSYSFALIALICGAFFLLIEKPCMDPKWPQKLAHWFASVWRSHTTDPRADERPRTNYRRQLAANQSSLPEPSGPSQNISASKLRTEP